MKHVFRSHAPQVGPILRCRIPLTSFLVPADALLPAASLLACARRTVCAILLVGTPLAQHHSLESGTFIRPRESWPSRSPPWLSFPTVDLAIQQVLMQCSGPWNSYISRSPRS